MGLCECSDFGYSFVGNLGILESVFKEGLFWNMKVEECLSVL